MSRSFDRSTPGPRLRGRALFGALVCTILGLTLGAAAASAQTAPATQAVTVQGTVQDSTGAILTGVTVRGHQGDQVVGETVTGTDGRFTLRLPPGGYSLEVVAPSFSPFTQSVTVRAPMTPLLFKLDLAPVQQTMDVKDEPYQISLQPDQNSNSLVLDQTQVQQQMPDDEDELAALLQELAGPAANAVGGADIVTDGFTNGRVPPKDQIREIKINNNPFSSESSRPGQGRIEITTRAGSDSLRGNISYEVRDAVLNARNAFANERPPYHRDDYRGNLSGPLIKDKMSFAASYRHMDTNDNDALQATTLNGVVNDPVLRPNSIRDYNGRIEYQLPRNNFLNLALGWRSNSHGNEGVGGFTLPERATNSDNQEFSMQVRESAPVTESMVQELRFSLERNYSFTKPLTSGIAINVQDSFNGGGATRHSDQTTYEYQFGDTLTYSHSKLGMKFGYQGNLQRFNILSADNFNGTYVFSDLASYEAGVPTTFTQTVGTPLLNMSQFQSGEFVQTDYKLSRTLMLSFGLRHEAQTNISDHNNFDPRFGFAYGVGKNSVVRGGFGAFHQRLNSSTVQGLMQLDGTRQIQTVLLYCLGKVDSNGVSTDAPNCVPPPGSLAALGNPFLFVPGGAGKIPLSVRQASATLALPYTANGSLSFETKLKKSTFVSATYDYVHGLHLYRTRNINAPLTGTADPLNPEFQNFLLLESSASSRYQDLSLRLNQRLGSSANSLFLNYTLAYNRNDTDGNFSLPANNYDLRSEWGRSADDQRHTVFAGMNYQLPWKVTSSGRFRASTGRPYNITTGHDDNRDTTTNDRPVGVTRNSGDGPGFFEIDLTLKKSFSLKPAPAKKTSQAPRATSSQGGREAPSAPVEAEAPRGQGASVTSDTGGGRGRGGPQMSITANISNLLNHTNFNKFSGVLTSPYFGRANSARDPRDIELIVQFTF